MKTPKHKSDIEVFCQIPMGEGDFDGPEGIVQGNHGLLYISSGDGWIYTVSGSGEVKAFAEPGGRPLGIAIDKSENLYVCEAKSGAVYRITPQAGVSLFAERSGSRKMLAPNFAVFDDRGWLYVSDSGSSTLETPKPDGAIFRISPSGECEIFADGLLLPNGLAMRKDESALYVIQSTEDNILRLEINDDQSLGDTSVFAQDLEMIPDGMAFADDGDLFVIAGGSDTIYQVKQEGQMEIFAQDPPPSIDHLFAAANCVFAGPEFSDLYITNLGGFISRIKDVPRGQKLFHQQL
ncbi:MAG: SMP-30/gluconolactonase/LRE family protein [Anaerolineae bacterium]|nr:SMP-30/gluconolactonase/LRE family protein [Anaerolineae bacterium]